MKNAHLLFFILSLFLVSCNQSFYNTKQHAHRNYIKIGPGVKMENEPVVLTSNPIEKMEVVKVEEPIQQSAIASTVQKDRRTKSIPGKIYASEKTYSTPNRASIKHQQAVFKRHKTKQVKKTNETPVLNILSFVIGLISVVMLLITLFIALFSLAFPYLIGIVGSLLGVVMGIGLLAVILGILGVSLQHPKKGLGIAGIATGGVAIFIGLIALALYFVFL